VTAALLVHQEDSMVWSDQVAVVTGGSRGIGRATALMLARQGAAVCVNYATRPDAAEAVVGEIVAAGGRAMAVGADVADSDAVASMVDHVVAQWGAVTILVNNAGVSNQATLDSYDAAQFERMRRVNVDGIIHATRAVMAGMRARRYGRIVNVASIAAIGTALPGNAFYAASKGEIPILTRRFAMELGPQGITVNAVAPGFVRSDMTQANRGKDGWAAVEKALSERAMMRRIGEPEDIAHAVAFLVAPESGWITAQTLVVDGGRMDYIGHA
jgi:3-oxoacyl-[acyl-carrier protein] reductase